MNNQFCKVGKIKPNLSKALSLKDIERRINNFVDDLSKVEYSKDLKTSI
ncbi:hypothetical protein [Seonamhaeicola sediminis]|nr:hypothetical protein [Seonamhaeicola sediminis]